MARALVALALVSLCLCTKQVLARPAPVAVQTLSTNYTVLIRSGDKVPGWDHKDVTFGAQYDIKDKPVLNSDGTPAVANNPDFTSYIWAGEQLFVVNQHEISPAAYYVLSLEQKDDGHLKVDMLQPVSYSEWGPSVRPCAGSKSPWKTHLGGEENYPNVRTMLTDLETVPVAPADVSSEIRDLMIWYGIYLGNPEASAAADNTALQAAAEANGQQYFPFSDVAGYLDLAKRTLQPYMVGHIFEISLDRRGRPTFQKHLALGRSSFELALVLPDLKTVYLADDAGNSGGFMKFICDTPGDLSKGTMYAAKLTQTNAAGSASLEADVSWVELGHLDHDILLEAAKKPISELPFSYIFEHESIPDAANATCSPEFKIVLWDSGLECLKLNTTTPNVEMLAVGLETRRYITYKGATSQYSKFEGVTYDKLHNRLYGAISFQQNSMLPGGTGPGEYKNDQASADEVKVQGNRCGCTYAFDLDAQHSATKMYAQICGIETTENGTEWCSMTSIANPDNLGMFSYISDTPWLIISEDSSYRNQSLVHVHHTESKQTIIVAAAEMGAETTGTGYQHIGDYHYISTNFQGSESEDAPIGYLGPWKINAKNVTFQAHTPRGNEYKWPYAP